LIAESPAKDPRDPAGPAARTPQTGDDHPADDRVVLALLDELMGPLVAPPAPWNIDIDFVHKDHEDAVFRMQHVDAELTLRICRWSFACAIARQDRRAAVHALYLLCVISRNCEDLVTADRIFEHVLARRQTVRNLPLGVRITLFHSRQLRYVHLEFVLAMQMQQEALDKALSIGDARGTFYALTCLTETAAAIGDHELVLALDAQQRNLLPDNDVMSTALRGNRDNRMANAWREIAMAHRRAGHEAMATECFGHALTLARSAVAVQGRDRAHALDTLVELLLFTGDVGAARERFDRFTEEVGEPPATHNRSRAAWELARARLQVREGTVTRETTRSLENLARLQAEGVEIDIGIAEVQGVLMTAYESLGLFDAALACHDRCSQWYATTRTAQSRQRARVVRQSVLAMRAEAIEFVVHDLLTPLAAARTWLQTLGRSTDQVEASLHLGAALEALIEATRLADGFLAVSRAELMPRDQLTVLDLGALVDDIAENAVLGPEGPARIERSIEIGTSIRGDRVLLAKSINTLLSLALDHAGRNSVVQLCLTPRGANGAARAMLRIDYLGRPFPLSWRVRAYQHVNDGLPIAAQALKIELVSKVARLHRAHLRFDDEGPVGQRLTLSFPLVA
jgi:signal transduction histidine kinase